MHAQTGPRARTSTHYARPSGGGGGGRQKLPHSLLTWASENGDDQVRPAPPLRTDLARAPFRCRRRRRRRRALRGRQEALQYAAARYEDLIAAHPDPPDYYLKVPPARPAAVTARALPKLTGRAVPCRAVPCRAVYGRRGRLWAAGRVRVRGGDEGWGGGEG